MSDSHYIDVIIFAMVAIFIGLRLRAALGRRTGNERPPRELGPVNGTVTPFRPAADTRGVGPVIEATAVPSGEAAVAATLARIQSVDPSLTPDAFMGGARAAFEMILGAFTKGDEAALRPLLSDEVFSNFLGVIQTRRTANETCENRLVRIVAAEIVEAELTDRQARITVRFTSQQVIVVRNAAGAVVEGDPDKTVQLIDLWTFARDPRSRDPNWLLVATRSQEE
jgi:predicted lipid-binding transport protein (Tim44 family)